MKKKILLLAIVLAGMTSIAIAQTDGPPGGGEEGQGMGGPGGSNGGAGGSGPPHGPPPQAIEACKDKSSGASCSFVGRNNQTRTGTCFAPEGGNHPLACRPERGSEGQGTGSMNGKEPQNGGMGGKSEGY